MKTKALFCFFAFLFFITSLNADSSVITVDYSFSNPELKYNPDNTVEIFHEGLNQIRQVGEPMLPVKTAKILIARDEIVKKVTVIENGERILPGKHFINYGSTVK